MKGPDGVAEGSRATPGAGAEAHLTHPMQAEVSFQPEEGEVSVAGLKEVRRHQHPHVHVDGNKLRSRREP